MSDEGIQQAIRSFIADYIDSVVQLEVLLMLHRAPEIAWTAADIASELRIDPAWAGAQLEDLCTRRLLECPQDGIRTYRYAPQTPQLDVIVQGLAHAYEQRRVSVINLIYSKPVDRLRHLADAFRSRKDPSDG